VQTSPVVERVECAAPRAPQPTAAGPLAMAFSSAVPEGRHVASALMALADTSMVFAILAANRGYRPMQRR